MTIKLVHYVSFRTSSVEQWAFTCIWKQITAELSSAAHRHYQTNFNLYNIGHWNSYRSHFSQLPRHNSQLLTCSSARVYHNPNKDKTKQNACFTTGGGGLLTENKVCWNVKDQMADAQEMLHLTFRFPVSRSIW